MGLMSILQPATRSGDTTMHRTTCHLNTPFHVDAPDTCSPCPGCTMNCSRPPASPAHHPKCQLLQTSCDSDCMTRHVCTCWKYQPTPASAASGAEQEAKRIVEAFELISDAEALSFADSRWLIRNIRDALDKQAAESHTQGRAQGVETAFEIHRTYCRDCDSTKKAHKDFGFCRQGRLFLDQIGPRSASRGT